VRIISEVVITYDRYFQMTTHATNKISRSYGTALQYLN